MLHFYSFICLSCINFWKKMHIVVYLAPCKGSLFKETFDSGCNFCISGCKNRLSHIVDSPTNTRIMGFNGASSSITSTGINYYNLLTTTWKVSYAYWSLSTVCTTVCKERCGYLFILFGSGYVPDLDSNHIKLILIIQEVLYYLGPLWKTVCMSWMTDLLILFFIWICNQRSRRLIGAKRYNPESAVAVNNSSHSQQKRLFSSFNPVQPVDRYD
jgi:hypothetical protein